MSAEHEHPDLACKRVVEMVTDYLEGALPTEDAAQLEQHLVLCDPCVQYVDQHRTLIAALGKLPALDSTASPAATASNTAALEAFRKLRKEAP
jgi:anti-sigma factor RsiW